MTRGFDLIRGSSDHLDARNMQRRLARFRIVVLAACAVVWTGPLVAKDRVVLDDGSIVHGTIVKLLNSALEIKPYAASSGVITYPLRRVRVLSSDHDHRIELVDGRVVKGRLHYVGNGPVVLRIRRAEPDPKNETKTRTEDESDEWLHLSSDDIASIDASKPKASYDCKGRFDIDGRTVDGNQRRSTLGLSGDIEARSAATRFLVRGNWKYEESDNKLDARNALGFFKADQFWNKRMFTYVNNKLEGDEKRDIELRTTTGVGFGYQFFDRKQPSLPLSYYEELGVSYVDSQIANARDDSFGASRLSGKFDWDLGDRVELFHFHEVIWGLEDHEDVNLSARSGLRVRLAGDLYSTTEIEYKFDNQPADDLERSDTEYKIGLGYIIKF